MTQGYFAVERLRDGSVRQIVGPFRIPSTAWWHIRSYKTANGWRVETWETLNMKRPPSLESDTIKTRRVSRSREPLDQF